MAAFLVTGNPDSGKTTLAEELSRRGLTALDSDYVPRLCHYEDDAGKTYSCAEAPRAPDEEWLSTHRWVWSRARLQEVLKDYSNPVFICGIAENIRDVVDLFDCVFLRAHPIRRVELAVDADRQLRYRNEGLAGLHDRSCRNVVVTNTNGRRRGN